MGSVDDLPALSQPPSAAAPASTLLPSAVATPRPRFLIIGAGSRGHAYARSITSSTRGLIAAVAEPVPFKRNELGAKYIWGPQGRSSPANGEAFESWSGWLEYEVQRQKQVGGDEAKAAEGGVCGVFVCTLDETHAEIIMAIAKAGVKVHVLCEKPLATNWEDCLGIWRSIRNSGKVFGVGHVLRYSPHNMLLRKLLLEDNVIGDLISIEHTEPVGWWHFAHSYVRGNWRHTTPAGVGSLLTKSCHDIDFIMWLLCSPAPSPDLPIQLAHGTRLLPPHLPSTISSTGHLSYFRRSRKPAVAGASTNCISCPAEPTCIYSAEKIYIERHLYGERDTGWPVKIVAPEIEDVVGTSGWSAGEKLLRTELAEDYDPETPPADIAARTWYGRCVYESDNDVCDDQVVTITWDDDSVPSSSSPGAAANGPLIPHRAAKTAIFHMVAQTQRQCDRYGSISGTLGVVEYDGTTINAHSFVTDKTSTWTPPKPNPKEQGHGGGDDGLARQFVSAVEAVEAGTMSAEEANMRFLGVSLEECVRSHGVVFAAEGSRLNRGMPVEWQEWCQKNWIP